MHDSMLAWIRAMIASGVSGEAMERMLRSLREDWAASVDWAESPEAQAEFESVD
jgi:hypothetical protein